MFKKTILNWKPNFQKKNWLMNSCVILINHFRLCSKFKMRLFFQMVFLILTFSRVPVFVGLLKVAPPCGNWNRKSSSLQSEHICQSTLQQKRITDLQSWPGAAERVSLIRGSCYSSVWSVTVQGLAKLLRVHLLSFFAFSC